MGITIRDVAKRAGVSISTVSRVLNDTTPVSADKRRRVEEAVEALGYIPNPAAQILHRHATGGLGVLLPYVGGEFFSELLTGIDQTAQAAGYFLLISTSHRNETHFREALLGIGRRVDGLIIMATEMTAERVARLIPIRVPVVFCNTESESGAFDVVDFDNFGGAYRITGHLLDLGHRRLAIIKGPPQSYDARERLRGCRAAVAAFGPDVDLIEIEGSTGASPGGDAFSHVSGYRSTASILALDPRPTAILAPNDQSALGVLHAVREAGLRVPEDVSVTGFDDIPGARYTSPPLTTVLVPIREILQYTTERLIERIRSTGPAEPVQEKVPLSLVVRRSTAPPAGA